MPSFDLYKKFNGGFRTNGEVHKIQSDEVIEATWDEDLESKIAYLYDYYTDDEPLKFKNLHPQKSLTKIPVEVKFIVNAHNSDSKEQVSFKIMFKPSFNWESIKGLSYYNDRFIDKYDAEFPIGNYVDLPDEKGNYRKWIITGNADWLGNQFPTWFVLPCDHVFQWVFDDKLYQMCGITRNQNSYNVVRFIIEILCLKFSNCWKLSYETISS